MSDAPDNGAAKPAPALPYIVGTPFMPEETVGLVTGLLPLDKYMPVVVTLAGPAQPARSPQGLVMATDNDGNPIGMLFMLPVVLPIKPPVLSRGVLGMDGKPMEATQIEGPVGAMARVIVPRASVIPEVVKAHDKALEALTSPAGGEA